MYRKCKSILLLSKVWVKYVHKNTCNGNVTLASTTKKQNKTRQNKTKQRLFIIH